MSYEQHFLLANKLNGELAEENRRLIAELENLRDCAYELIDIVEGHIQYGDEIDSLTTQPMRLALRAFRKENEIK